ncbi:unnamed protein product, partial [Adineta ricciae]
MSTSTTPNEQELVIDYNHDDLYEGNTKISYMHLEKGLLLFVYLHETSSILKANARIYKKLWTGQICYHSIVPNNFHDPYFCSFDHSEAYKQPNLCRNWYTRSCTQMSCENQHYFIPTKAKHYMNNETDLAVWDLMRFIRQFFRHFKQSVIDKEDLEILYREIILIMVCLINCAYQNIDRLALFLPQSIVNQMNRNFQQELLEDSTCHIPKIFLTPENIKFNSRWYTQLTHRVGVNFYKISPELIKYLSRR